MENNTTLSPDAAGIQAALKDVRKLKMMFQERIEKNEEYKDE